MAGAASAPPLAPVPSGETVPCTGHHLRGLRSDQIGRSKNIEVVADYCMNKPSRAKLEFMAVGERFVKATLG